MLGPIVGIEVELSRRVPVDVTIETGDAETRLLRLAVVGRVELLLREGSHQQPQAVELDRREDVLEQPVIVVDRDDLAARDVAQFPPLPVTSAPLE